MVNPLAETCLYTILHPEKLAEAAALRGPSTFVVGQRMVSAAALFDKARTAGWDFAVLFGDATRCRRLVYWARLTAIDVGKWDTHYTVFPVHELGTVRSTQDLVLNSTGERIAEGFIKPYAIVRIPVFLLRKGKMAMPAATPMQELETVLGHYDHDIDEPETVPFIATVRERGTISDSEWKDVLRWLDEAMIYLKNGMPKDKGGALMIDADPRNADWLRTVRAQRLSGHRMPLWASLWLWWIGHDREGGIFWKQIGAVAKSMKFPRFKETRR